MLLEAHAGVFGNAGGIGIESLEKIPDLLLNLFPDLFTARLMHLRLHPTDPSYLSRQELNLSFKRSRFLARSLEIRAADKFRFRGEMPTYADLPER